MTKNKKLKNVIYYGGIFLLFMVSLSYRLTMETNIGLKTPGYTNRAIETASFQSGDRFILMPELTNTDELNQKITLETYMKKLVDQDQIQAFLFLDINQEVAKKLSTVFPEKIFNLSQITCSYIKLSKTSLLINNQKDVCNEYNIAKSIKIDENTINSPTPQESEKAEVIYPQFLEKPTTGQEQETPKNESNTKKRQVVLKLLNQTESEQDVFYDLLVTKSSTVQKTKVTNQANKDFYEVKGIGKFDFQNPNSYYQLSKFQIMNNNILQKYDEKIVYLASEENKKIVLLDV